MFLQSIAVADSSNSNSNKGLSMKRFRLALKRKKKSKKNKDSTANSSETGKSVEDEDEDQEEDDELEDEEEYSNEHGFAVITPDTVTEAEREQSKQILKSSKFNWTSHRCLLEGLQGVTLRALVCGQRLIVCGGATATGQPNTNVFYCPARNVTYWAKIGQTTPQYYGASVIVNRELVLIGGICTLSQRCTRKISTYDFQQKIWVEVLPPLATARSSPTAVVWGDYLIVIGGIDESGRVMDSVEMLHLPSLQWNTAMPLPCPLAGASAVVYRSRLYVMGGATSTGLTRMMFSIGFDRLLSSTSRLNRFTSTSSSVWERQQDSPYTMMSLCLFNGYMLAFGGDERTASLSQPAEWVWSFFPDSNGHTVWTLVQRMYTGRKLCAAVSLSSSVIVVLGGNPYFSVLDIANVTLPSLR